MDAFLKENKLDHLCDALATSLTLQESLTVLDQGRPKLLEKLKELGVTKIPDRQAFAKAVSNQRRNILGAGAPVVVCMYSAGVNKQTGRSLMSKLLSACSDAGLPDQIVLDHHNEAPYDVHTSFDAYIDALYDTVIAEKPDRATRPWVLLAHSHGATGTYGLARKLGPKVRALVVIGRRAPHVELLDDVLGVSTGQQVGEMGLRDVAQRIGAVYSNQALEAGTASADEAKWAPSFLEVANIIRAQYASACSLCAADAIAAYMGTPDALPAHAKLPAPILAISSTRETPQGETRVKVERWAELTTGAFRLDAVDCDHMAMPNDERCVQMTLEFLKPAIDESRAADPTNR